MSKFKGLTGNTPPLSLDGKTGEAVQPSKQSVKTAHTQTFTGTTKKPFKPIRISDKDLQHSEIARVALSHLLKAGLVRRFKVLSEDGTTVKEIQMVFDPEIWSENLELKVL